jgi:hypothetical protein
MLFPLMMILLFLAPLCGYYWLWSRHKTALQSVPNLANVFLGLCLAYGLPIVLLILFGPIMDISWFIFLLWGVVGTISLAVYLHFAKKSPPQKSKHSHRTRWANLLAISLLVFFNLAPMFAYAINTTHCFYESQDGAKLLVQAISAYKTDNHVYPLEFDDLTPTYIDPIPMRTCDSSQASQDWNGCEVFWHGEFISTPLNETINMEINVLIWFHQYVTVACLDGALS